MELNVATRDVPATLTAEAVERLRRQISADAEAGVRVLVLRGGDDDVFCGGLDLEEACADTGQVARAAQNFAACLDALDRFPAPVVAVVTGAATGGGVGLVAAADLVIAGDRATFGLSELLFGLLPAIIAPAVLSRLTPSRFKRWSLTCERWDAASACAAGLVDVVASHADVQATTYAWVRRLMRPEPSAVAAFKTMLHDLASGSTPDLAAISGARVADENVRRALGAFVHGGRAPWERG
jgi:enoyl-CoA hydratase/carnithine racemase